MTSQERIRLIQELRRIQDEHPSVVVAFDLEAALGRKAQDRVDEIERMLAADIAQRVPPADLEE